MSPLILERKLGDSSTVDITQVPDYILAQIPTLPPPPGVTSNFINPEDHGPIVVAVSSIGILIILICTIIRIWVIFKLSNPVRWNWGDTTFIVAILSIFTTAVNQIVGSTGTGQAGIHIWNTPLLKTLSHRSIATIALTALLTPLSAGLIKTAIFLTYTQLFSSIKWSKYVCYAGIAVTIGFYGSIVIFSIAWAFPLSIYLKPSSKIRTVDLSIPVGVAGFVIDVYLLVVPLVAISGLKSMALRKKLGVALVFSAGFLAIICAILSIFWRIKNRISTDWTWNMGPLLILIITELSIGVIIACTPHIAMFLRQYGSKIDFSCCGRFSKKKGESKETSSGGSETSAKSAEPAKPVKLYPDLDISTIGGTRGGTIIDRRDQELKSEEVTRVKEHPAAKYPANTHWAERQRDIQENFCAT